MYFPMTYNITFTEKKFPMGISFWPVKYIESGFGVGSKSQTVSLDVNEPHTTFHAFTLNSR